MISAKVNVIIVIVTVVFVSVCAAGRDGIVYEKAGIDEETRSVKKEIREDQWRAIETVQLDTSGWIPDSNVHQQDSSPPVKRRRLRKRKRRPQAPAIAENQEIPENSFASHRIKRPQHLHERQDFWTQMEEDANIRQYKRRRISPLYHDKQSELPPEDKISVFQADEGVRKTKVSTTSTEAIPDLKTVLKQAGGSSLSEILQKKNLSLSDLLKGEKEAILAITEKPHNLVITEYKNPLEVEPPKKLKYNSSYRSTTKDNKNIQSTTEESIVTQRHSYEESIHRVSIKPNNVIVVDYKPNIIGLDLTARYIDTKSTTTNPAPKENYAEVKHKLTSHLPITSAKLNKILKASGKNVSQNEISSTTLPPKAYRINIDEIFGISTIKQKVDVDKDEEGPLRMSLDLNRVVELQLLTSTKAPIESTTTTTEVVPEKLRTITAKDEILDIMQDEDYRKQLKRVLERRNMTLDDLVDLRERGSSQKHLADLFHNKTREPEAKDEPLVGSVRHDSPNRKEEELPAQSVDATQGSEFLERHLQEITTARNKIQIDRQPKTHHSLPMELKNTNSDAYPASIEAIEDSNESKSIEESKDKDKYVVTSFPTYKIELYNPYKEKPPAPISDTWTNNFPELFDDFYQRTHQKGIVEDLNEKYFNDIRTIDDVENAISENGNEKLTVETKEDELYEDINDYDVFIKLPYGVKHAILASLLIIGISLVIFLTILMIFKWSQKHKKKLCYNGSFSCSKIRSPILQNPERRSFKTFMSATLGRKKRYYKQHLQSMSDSIWENDRKPFQ